MSDPEAVAAASLPGRVALLALAHLEREDGTPADATGVRGCCTDLFAGGEDPIFGGLSEADVTRALYELEADGLVVETGTEDQSPAGKGRTLYEPGVPIEVVTEALADDERVGEVADRIRG